GDRQALVIECISLLRIVSIANEDSMRVGFSSEQARHFLTQVLAHNLGRVFPGSQTEAVRINQAEFNESIDRLFAFIVSHIGYEDILASLCDEIWRIMGERPIQVGHVKSMITQIAITLAEDEGKVGDKRVGAERLISALFGPTQGCRDDPGAIIYTERLSAMDQNALQQEAHGFARAMHDVGLVSDYHAVFLRWLLENGRNELIADALGLSSTGLDSLRCYSELVYKLIEEAIYPETAQTVYGLALMLERGILYMPSIGPALWRQIGLKLSDHAATQMAQIYGDSRPPRVFLLAGVISVLGQPLGVGQGNNPTCQAARAISMWSLNDPDYLLYLIAQAARFDSILMHFEGQPIHSADLPAGLIRSAPLDTAPVSTLLVPHLDRIYNQMGVLCETRGEDPHCWINPEFHGWWVGRQFAIAVDIQNGKLKDYEQFVRHFFASYHPLYNGNNPVIHPQPAGLAVTDSAGRFVGWHAITLLRVALDQEGIMRVYFYNPNNDSGQNWGHGVIVSTQNHGERYGESSLPFNQLASRLYIFHDEPFATPPLDSIPTEEVQSVKDMAIKSWAKDRLPEIINT
ncbi:MAG: hypothetical protein R3352_07720, partial [Salinisphaeraceae bacterium]|nr:hypothetical protein [Salinisphaeraceae bacterium]